MSELPSQPPSASHVAIIMDGNGRWAELRGRPRLFGHHAGAKRIQEMRLKAKTN